MTAAKLCVVLLLSLCSLTACGEKKDVRSGVVYIPQEVTFSSPLDHTDSACISGATVSARGVTNGVNAALAVAGVLGQSIIINLPGRRKGALENLAAMLPALPHALDKLHGDPADCGG